MTQIVFNKCAHCGVEFRTFYTKGKQQLYHNNSCKQKAYKARKKQQAEMEKRTLTLEAWTIQQRVVDKFGERADIYLGAFFNAHGKEAYQDLLIMCDAIFAANEKWDIPF